MRHKLDLRGNALDSLNEGLRKYREALDGDVRAYKFAVLHFAHFMELLLKSGVANEHELLIYVKPGAQRIESTSTIGLWDALNILRNAGHSLDPELLSDLDWLKKLRNSIEHHQFDLDPIQTRDALGRLLRAAAALTDVLELPPLAAEVAHDCHDVFEQLLDEYQQRLAIARADARDSDEEVTNCSYCGELATAYEQDGSIKCSFCSEVEPLRECVICSETYRDTECTVWNDEHEGEPDYACTYCQDRIFGED